MKPITNPEGKKFERKPNRPFPRYGLEKTLSLARAITDDNAGKPMNRILLADAVKLKPSGIQFRDLLSASYKYGLTEGTEKAAQIKLTDLGRKLTQPQSTEEEKEAKRTAILLPPIFKKIFVYYNNAKLPSGEFFENTLVREFGIPQDYKKEAVDLVNKNGKYAGIIRDVSKSPFVILDIKSEPVENIDPKAVKEETHSDGKTVSSAKAEDGNTGKDTDVETEERDDNRRVFIAHGKNQGFIKSIKDILELGDWESVVTSERQTVSKPVPDKVMKDMRGCVAAIIHVDDETKIIDQGGKEHIVLNPNVLIEIGAAMALYGNRFVLLVKEDITLPSNLQGLYEVRYSGDSFDGETTIKILKAVKDIKSNPLPSMT